MEKVGKRHQIKLPYSYICKYFFKHFYTRDKSKKFVYLNKHSSIQVIVIIVFFEHLDRNNIGTVGFC